MIRIIQFNSIAKARIWVDEVVLGRPVFGQILVNSVASRKVDSLSEKLAGVEIFTSSGPKVNYGLLTLKYCPDDSNRIRINVPCGVNYQAPWKNSLSGILDEVYLGLQKEFSEEILETLSSISAELIPSGSLEVYEAAQGNFGSSRNIFRKLSIATIELLALDTSEFNSSQIVERLRNIFQIR